MNSVEPMFACLRAPRATDVLVDIARDFSPRLERHGPACVVCDVSGLGRLLGDPAAIGQELATAAAARVKGGAIRIALAPTRTATLLLTMAHAEPTVVTNDVATALAGLPLAHLQQLIVESAGTARLRGAATKSGQDATRKRHERAFDMARRWGLATLGDLAALPAGQLSARMGQDGIRLQQLARGQDDRPLIPDPDIPRFIERVELEWPVDTLEPLSFVLARLLDPLSASLERADRGAAAIRLDLRLIDKTMYGRVLTLPVAMRDARVLRTLLLLDLESHPPPAAVDVVTIEVDPAPGRVIQHSLLERAVPSAETLATLTARLGALVGEARCGSPVLLDTYRPDGFEMRRFDLSLREPGSGRRKTGTGDPGSGIRDRGSASERPTGNGKQGTDCGERQATGNGEQETGNAKRTAGSEHLAPVLRRFRPPVAVRVTVERGRPAQIAIDRRGMPGGPVAQSAGPWRTSGGWWDPVSTHWDRDEWDVVLRDGCLCRLFREQGTGTWFVEGVLD